MKSLKDFPNKHFHSRIVALLTTLITKDIQIDELFLVVSLIGGDC